jgi:hypothetical protein
MRCLRAVAVALFAGTVQPSGWAAGSPPPDDPSARDLPRIVAWFEGAFDNQEQVWFETEGRAQVPAERRHERVHAIHRRAALPAFGPHVFYVEEYRDDDPGKVFRQRLVTFESAREQGVRMRLWFFRDSGAVRGAHADPSKLAALTTQDVFFLPGCDVYWLPQADQYAGGMRERSCQFGEGAQRRWSQHDLVLSPSKYWRIDRTFFVDSGRLAVGHPDGVPHKLNRAKTFSCDVNVYGRDYLAGPSDDDQSFTAQPLHSQGGTVRFERKADGKTYVLRLRDKEYPYYATRPDFMFLSVRPADGPFIAYSLHDPDARFIGFNLGWMLVACERTSP